MHARFSLSGAAAALAVAGAFIACGALSAGAQPAYKGSKAPVANCPPGQHLQGTNCVSNGVKIAPLRKPFQQKATVGVRRCYLTGGRGAIRGGAAPTSCAAPRTAAIGSRCQCVFSGRNALKGIVR